MKSLILIGCLLATTAALTGCGGQSYPGDKRFPLSGSISYGGEAIDLGSLTLKPSGGEAKSVSGAVIKDGRYDIPEVKGPNAGTYTVEISWLKLTGRRLLDNTTGEMYDERVEALPAKYHKRTELKIEVPEATNEHDFELAK